MVNGKGVLIDVSALDYPVKAFAFTPYGNIPFYICNNANETISGSVEDIENISLSFKGAPWSEDLMFFNSRINAPAKRLYDQLWQGEGLTKEQKDSIYRECASIEELKKQIYLEYPNSWVTLDDATSILSDSPREILEKIFSQLSTDRKESAYGKMLEKYLSLKQISEGDRMGDYDIQGLDQNGMPFRLSDMEEPYIVLDFSQCYCGPCIQATKEIKELREKYAGKIGFVNYSCDDLEKDWRKAIKRDQVEWPSVFDGTGSAGTISLMYNVSSYPSFFIFGPDRKLITKWNGYGPGAIEKMLPKEAKE